MKLLIVDDHPAQLEVLAITLARVGFEVTTTSDPNQALAILRRDLRIKRVLSDINMPGMSGWELYLQMESDLVVRDGLFAAHSLDPEPDMVRRFASRGVPVHRKGRYPQDIFASPSHRVST